MRSRFAVCLCTFPLLAILAMGPGCGTRGASPPTAGKQPQVEQQPSPAADSSPPGSDTSPPPGPSGTLAGRIVFDGDQIPPQTMVPIQTDPEFCEKHGAQGLFPMEDYLIDPQTRGIRYVIVYLKGESIRRWPHTPKTKIVIDNRNCRFEPHIGLATVGSLVEVRNSDDVYHTTHLYGPGGFQYNPGLRTKGESEQTELTRPGTYVVKCDRHGWMSAFLRVDDHPFHAVTDEQGRFEIKNIPPGTHQVEVFHEKFGERPIPPDVIEVKIEADQTATLDLKLSH
jgi:plastocyanin